MVVELKCGHRVSAIGKIHKDSPMMKGGFADIKDNRKNRAFAQLALQQLAVEVHAPSHINVIGVVVFVKPLEEPRLCELPSSFYSASHRLLGYQCTRSAAPLISVAGKESGARQKRKKIHRQTTLSSFVTGGASDTGRIKRKVYRQTTIRPCTHGQHDRHTYE